MFDRARGRGRLCSRWTRSGIWPGVCGRGIRRSAVHGDGAYGVFGRSGGIAGGVGSEVVDGRGGGFSAESVRDGGEGEGVAGGDERKSSGSVWARRCAPGSWITTGSSMIWTSSRRSGAWGLRLSFNNERFDAASRYALVRLLDVTESVSNCSATDGFGSAPRWHHGQGRRTGIGRR
jgi:hypothetical protein